MKEKKYNVNYIPFLHNKIAAKRYIMADFYAACPYHQEQLFRGNRKQELVAWRQLFHVWDYMNTGSLSETARNCKSPSHASTYGAIKRVFDVYDCPQGYAYFMDALNLIKRQVNETIAIPQECTSTNELVGLAVLENNLNR